MCTILCECYLYAFCCSFLKMQLEIFMSYGYIMNGNCLYIRVGIVYSMDSNVIIFIFGYIYCHCCYIEI